MPLPEIVPSSKDEKAREQTGRAIRSQGHPVGDGQAPDLVQLAGSACLALVDACLRKLRSQSQSSRGAKVARLRSSQRRLGTRYAARCKLKDGWTLHASSTVGFDASWVSHLERDELPGIGGNGKKAPWIPAAEADSLCVRFLASLDDQHRTFSDSDQRDARRGDRFLARRVEDFHQLFFCSSRTSSVPATL